MNDSRTDLSRFTAIFASGTMFSRVLGLVRNIVLTLVPVTSREYFIVAFRLPNMLRDLIGEGAMNAAFVPVYTETRAKKGDAAFHELVSASLGAMLLLLAAVTAVGVLVAPWLVSGLNGLGVVTGAEPTPPEDLALLVSLTRWTFPYIFFIGLAVFAMGPLITLRKYGAVSWSPSLLNICIIAACWTLRDRFGDPAYALVVGVWAGGVAQVAALFFAMRGCAAVRRPSLNLRHPGVKTIALLIVPVILGQAAGEVNKLVDTLFAASLGGGAVNALFYANQLVQLPLSVFGIATSVAVLPAASEAAALNGAGAVRAPLTQGLRQSFFLIFPAMLLLIVLAQPIVRLLFEYNKFGPSQTEQTALALRIYALGLLSYAWVKVAVTGFFARQDTKSPAIIASASMVLNIALNVLLVRPLGFAGLALATVFAFTVNAAALLIVLRRAVGALWDTETLSALFRMAVAGALTAAVAYGAYVRSFALFPSAAISHKLACGFIPLGAAAAAYVVFCLVFRVPECRAFLRAFVRR